MDIMCKERENGKKWSSQKSVFESDTSIIIVFSPEEYNQHRHHFYFCEGTKFSKNDSKSLNTQNRTRVLKC